MTRMPSINGVGTDRSMKIGVFGLGYVGAVTTACLAELGHQVVGVDINPQKVESIRQGMAPVREPGLSELLSAQVAAGRVSATTDGVGTAADLDMVVLAVGTPSTPSGGTDTRHLLSAAAEIGEGLAANPRDFVAVVNRSTALPAAHSDLMEALQVASGRALGEGLGYVCHPEFLRETTAISDFFDPPMVIFGCDSDRTAELCRGLYPDLDAPVFEVPVGEAAMVKYASNSWHAVKVTFANEMGEICRRHDIDARQVMDLFCNDETLNISTKYLRPGNPFGGSCLPKDLRAVLDFARDQAVAVPMLQGSLLSNNNQLELLGDRVLAESPASVGVVGLSFKEGTDDLREAPMVPLVERLMGKGVDVGVYDAELAVDELVGSNAAFALGTVPHLADLVTSDLASVVDGADVLVINHRLAGVVDWTHLAISSNTMILDVVGVPELAAHPRYEGLYWPMQDLAANLQP